MINYYAVLGVHRKSTNEELAARFRELSLKLHPDRPGGDAGAFAAMSEADHILCSGRRDYDKKLKLMYDVCKKCSGEGAKMKTVKMRPVYTACVECGGCGYKIEEKQNARRVVVKRKG